MNQFTRLMLHLSRLLLAFGLLVGGCCNCACADITTGVLARYQLNENTGTSAADISGNGRTGTLTSVTWTAPGKLGVSAVNCDNAAARIDCTRFDTAPSGATSFFAWVRANATVQTNNVIGAHIDTYATNDCRWQLNNVRTANQIVLQNGGGATLTGSGITLANGVWNHVGFTFDGTNARLWVNGVGSSPGAFALGTDTNAMVRIGGIQQATGNNFEGDIDEVWFFSRALSSADVAELYNFTDFAPQVIIITHASPLARDLTRWAMFAHLKP